MRRCHEIERCGALRLQREKRRRKLLLRHLSAVSLVANLIVLTVDTAECAVGEEHRPCAVFSHEAGLLPCVQHRARNARQPPCAAEPTPACRAVDAAAPRAERTVFQ